MATKRKKTKAAGIANASKVREKAKQSRGSGGSSTVNAPEGIEFFQVESGKKYIIDILNYPVGEGNPWADKGEFWYERTFFVHRNVGPDNRWFICPTTIGKKCPICEYRQKLQKQGGDKKIIASLRAQKRQLFNVIDLQNAPGVVKLWDIPWWNFGKQLEGTIDNDEGEEGYENFANWSGGFSLKIGVTAESTGEGSNTYPRVTDVLFRKRKSDYTSKVTDSLVCLDDTLNIPSFKELAAAFFHDEDNDEEEEPEETDIDDEEVEDEDADLLDDEDEDVEDDSEDDVEEDEDDSEDDEDDVEEDEDDSEDDEDEWEDEEEADDGEADDDFFEDDDEADEDEDDVEEADDDFFEDDEEEAPKSKKKAAKKSSKKPAAKKKAASKKTTAKKPAAKTTKKKRR